jgi:PhoH-like ATPase
LLGLRAATYNISTSKYQQNLLKLTNYTGHREEPIAESVRLTVDSLYQSNIWSGVKTRKSLKLQENEFCILKGGNSGRSSVRCYQRAGKLFRVPSDIRIGDIEPLNNEQAYAMQLLMDPDVKMVTLTGRAGSGKTLLSIAAALDQVLGEEPEYSKVVISRSLTVMGGKDKLGFLPGGLKEKLQPFIMPLQDAIDFVLGENNDALAYLSGDFVDQKNKQPPKIEVEPLQFIRGRNIRNSIMIVDEAQNLTVQDIKTIITRISDNSKIILLGDLDQIDNYYVSRTTNGLAQTIEKFKDSEIVGHIQLLDGVRSELATEAADRL